MAFFRKTTELSNVKVFFNREKNEWKEKILKQRESGLSISKWCQENEESSEKFYYWKKKLFQKDIDKSSFIEIKQKKLPDNENKTGIRIEYEGIFFHLENDFNVSSLKKCLQSVKELC